VAYRDAGGCYLMNGESLALAKFNMDISLAQYFKPKEIFIETKKPL
jgi:hypothetical protein